MTASSPGSDEQALPPSATEPEPTPALKGVPPDLGAKFVQPPSFVSPMPTFEVAAPGTPTYLVVLAALAAFASVTFAALLYFKR